MLNWWLPTLVLALVCVVGDGRAEARNDDVRDFRGANSSAFAESSSSRNLSEGRDGDQDEEEEGIDASVGLSPRCVAEVKRATGQLSKCLLRSSAKLDEHPQKKGQSREASRCRGRFVQRVEKAKTRYGAERCAAAPNGVTESLRDETRDFVKRAEDLIEGELSQDLLFVLRADSASFEDGLLTLDQLHPGTVFFSNRPDQTSGALSTAAFLDAMIARGQADDGDLLKTSLSCLVDENRINVALMLRQQTRRGGGVVFESVRVAGAGGTLPQACSDPVLFFENLDSLSASLDLGTGACSSVDFAGISAAISSSPVWRNWSTNLAHGAPIPGEGYYFEPTTRDELMAIACQAKASGKRLRVSGQRHSQPPLVVGANSTASTDLVDSDVWLVDLRCYSDLETPGGSARIQLKTVGASASQTEHRVVVANAGVREDELSEFLQNNNLMLPTVTAGGFFSLGGVVAVDVHGASADQGILAETVREMEVLRTYPDVQIDTIDSTSVTPAGDLALPYERVALGSLGIMTSLTFEIEDRPFKESLTSSHETVQFSGPNARDDFASFYANLLFDSPVVPRVESFFDPYTDNFLVLKWDRPITPPSETPVPTATEISSCDAPIGGSVIPGVGAVERPVQNGGTRIAARSLISSSFSGIKGQVDAASAAGLTHWISNALRVVFMSYWIELPSKDEAGLKTAWDALQVIANRVDTSPDFRPVLPSEFRFVQSGDTLLAGSYTGDSDSLFVSIEVLGFPNPPSPGTELVTYGQNMLDYFGNIEAAWVAMGGAPHSGKIFGFFDPANQGAGTTQPFNPGFVDWLRFVRKGPEVDRFNLYRNSIDPDGTFMNQMVEGLLGCDSCSN